MLFAEGISQQSRVVCCRSGSRKAVLFAAGLVLESFVVSASCVVRHRSCSGKVCCLLQVLISKSV